MKAAGSGHELGSDLCHSFRPTLQTSGRSGSWGREGFFGADRRTLALSPLWSRAGTQMLPCYSGKWIPARNLHRNAEIAAVEEEKEEVEQVRSL